jgi:hypothetical protein
VRPKCLKSQDFGKFTSGAIREDEVAISEEKVFQKRERLLMRSQFRQSRVFGNLGCVSSISTHPMGPKQPFPHAYRLMTMINTFLSRSFFSSLALTSAMILSPAPFSAQTAGQDVHNAGTATKDAARDAGHAVKKTSKTSAAKTKSGTEKGYDKTKEGGTVAVDKTKETSVKAYDKSKEGVQKVADPSAAKKNKVTDQSRETKMKAKNDAKRAEQKAKDSTPR